MTQEEKNKISAFLDVVFTRVNLAKEHIRRQNYGLAYDVLSAAYPELKIKVDEE